MRWRRFVLVLPMLAGAGCTPVTVWAEYSHTGLMGAETDRLPHAVRTSEDVKVYYLEGPQGFELTMSKELRVVDGYEHVVLGRVRVRKRGGDCDASTSADIANLQSDIFKQLKAKAFEVGGNAVVYATSVFTRDTPFVNGLSVECMSGTMLDSFGSGWVVIDEAQGATRGGASGWQPAHLKAKGDYGLPLSGRQRSPAG